ncbi:hypothetical protein GPALN_006617 [Globodera pallida]|nr:hypothetical protein GPALN_006617 [Globodera pallida]
MDSAEFCNGFGELGRHGCADTQSFRLFRLGTICYLLFHWNACLYFFMSTFYGYENSTFDSWTFSHQKPWPENSVQSMFEIVDTLIGLLVFAAIIGDVGIMVSRAHLAKANFQEFVDGCKLYMQIRHVNQQMHDRVIKWVEYQWMGGVERAQPVDENNLLNALPPRLARELAAEFHLNALIRSPVFALCERGLLSELALRLQCHRFGPGDIVCRRGEIAKEMFVVKHGLLELLLDDDDELCEQHSISPRLLLEEQT